MQLKQISWDVDAWDDYMYWHTQDIIMMLEKSIYIKRLTFDLSAAIYFRYKN